VKPGGRLVYATCSLLPEENEAQIDFFLAQHPDFAILPVVDVWREALAKQPNAAPCPSGGNYLRLTPAQQGTDGFFVAILQRNAAAKPAPEPSAASQEAANAPAGGDE
jgi:16S rRNA (cytosine967-C5)-methyltransferase